MIPIENEKGEIKIRIATKFVSIKEWNDFYSFSPELYKVFKYVKSLSGEKDIGVKIVFRVALHKEWIEKDKDLNEKRYERELCKDIRKKEGSFCSCEPERLGKKYFRSKKEGMKKKDYIKELKYMRKYLRKYTKLKV